MSVSTPARQSCFRRACHRQFQGNRCRSDRRIGGGIGNRSEKTFRIVVLRAGNDLIPITDLDDTALLHHRDTITEMIDDGQVMADKQIRHAIFVLKILQKIEDLRLNGNIQRGGRLVADDEFRLEGQSAGDGNALSLASGKLMGIPIDGAAFHAAASKKTFDLDPLIAF